MPGDTQDPIWLLKEFLKRPPGESLEDLLCSDLAERNRIIRSVPRTYEIVGYHADIRELSLLASDGSVAICKCDARLRFEWLEDGSLPHVARNVLSGPVELTRTVDGWKIKNYLINGIPVRHTFRIYREASFSCADFTLVPRLLELSPRSLNLVIDFTNASPASAEILHSELRARRRFRLRPVKGRVRGGSRLEPGSTGIIASGWQVAPRSVPSPISYEFVIASQVADAVHLGFRLPGVAYG